MSAVSNPGHTGASLPILQTLRASADVISLVAILLYGFSWIPVASVKLEHRLERGC